MRQVPKLRPNGWDALVTGLVAALMLLTALWVWRAPAGGSLTAVVSVDGAEAERIDLTKLRKEETHIICAGGYELHLRLSADGAEIISSDCPTQDCVHTGKITRPGQSIVCLPARVSVQLKGVTAQTGVDAVVG